MAGTYRRQSIRPAPTYRRQYVNAPQIDVSAYGNNAGAIYNRAAADLAQSAQHLQNEDEAKKEALAKAEEETLKTNRALYGISIENKFDEYVNTEEFKNQNSSGQANSMKGFLKGLEEESAKSGYYNEDDGKGLIAYAQLDQKLRQKSNTIIAATSKIESANQDVRVKTQTDFRRDQNLVDVDNLGRAIGDAAFSGDFEVVGNLVKEFTDQTEIVYEMLEMTDNSGKLIYSGEERENLIKNHFGALIEGNVESDASRITSIEGIEGLLEQYDNKKYFVYAEDEGELVKMPLQSLFASVGIDEDDGRDVVEGILKDKADELKGIAIKQKKAQSLQRGQEIMSGKRVYNAADADDQSGIKNYRSTVNPAMFSMLPKHSGADVPEISPVFKDGNMTADSKKLLDFQQKVANGEFQELQGLTLVDLSVGQAHAFGEVPAEALDIINSASNTGDADGLIMGYEIYTRLQQESPPLAVNFLKKLNKDAADTMINFGINSNNVGPEIAAERLVQEKEWKNLPSEVLSQREADIKSFRTDGSTQEFIEDAMGDTFNDPSFFSRKANSEAALQSNTTQRSRYESELLAERDFIYMKTGDRDLADKRAVEAVNKNWGYSSVLGKKRFMKHPVMLSPALDGADVKPVKADLMDSVRTNAKSLGISIPESKLNDNIIIAEDSSWSPTTLRDKGVYAYRLYVVDNNGVMHDVSNPDGNTRDPWVPVIPTVSQEQAEAKKQDLDYEEYRLRRVQASRNGELDVPLFSFRGKEYGPQVGFGYTGENIQESLSADIRNIKNVGSAITGSVKKTLDGYNRAFGSIADFLVNYEDSNVGTEIGAP